MWAFSVMIEADFNNVTRERHIKARVPFAVAAGDRVVVFDPVEQESLDGEVIEVRGDRAIIDAGGGAVRPHRLSMLRRTDRSIDADYRDNTFEPTGELMVQ